MSKEFPKGATIGDLYDPAMKIEDQDEANEYFERLVQRAITHFGQAREEAESVNRSNLGYYAGYYDAETRKRVERLFRCHHPVFGPISLIGSPTIEQALQAGKDMAEGIDNPTEAE